MKRWSASTLAVVSALSACASTPPSPYGSVDPERSGSRYQPAHRMQLHAVPPLPTADLLINPKIVPEVWVSEALSVEPAGSGAPPIGEWERAPVPTRQPAAIQTSHGVAVTGNDVAQAALMCVFLHIVCPLVLPVLVPFAIVGVKATERVHQYRRDRHRRDRRVEPLLVIPESEERHLSALLKTRAGGQELAQRTEALLEADQLARTFPRDGSIIVDVETARFHPSASTWVTVRLNAQAQAIPVRGTFLPATRHVVDWHYGPVWKWTAEDTAAVEQGVAQALAALAEDILATYTYTRGPTDEELEAE